MRAKKIAYRSAGPYDCMARHVKHPLADVQTEPDRVQLAPRRERADGRSNRRWGLLRLEVARRMKRQLASCLVLG